VHCDRLGHSARLPSAPPVAADERLVNCKVWNCHVMAHFWGAARHQWHSFTGEWHVLNSDTKLTLGVGRHTHCRNVLGLRAAAQGAQE
jgi:hypothetical protein